MIGVVEVEVEVELGGSDREDGRTIPVEVGWFRAGWFGADWFGVASFGADWLGPGWLSKTWWTTKLISFVFLSWYWKSYSILYYYWIIIVV